MFVYVLRLSEGKYYVGKTENVEKRFLEHKQGKGAAWTRRYHPIEILESVPNLPFCENQKTLEYMARYGVENVRGAEYCQIEFSLEEREKISTALRGEKGLCYNCGGNHYVSDCPKNKNSHLAKKSVELSESSADEEYEESESTSDDGKKTFCARCGRNSHSIEECYARKHVTGFELSESSANEEYEESDSTSDGSKKTFCARCGRNSHSIEECYATKCILGFELSETDESTSNEETY